MFLSETHQKVLYYCYRHKYVSIESLRMLFRNKGNREQVRRQLHKMTQLKLLKSFKIFNQKRILDMVYTLDINGLEVLKETVNISKSDYEYYEFLKQSYKHRSVLADFDIRLRATKGVTWYSESESIHQFGDKYTDIVRPDATILLSRSDGNNVTIFIEYEHTSRPKELIKKVKRYDEYMLYDSHLEHPYIKIEDAFFLFIVVDTEARKENCLDALNQIGDQAFKIQVLTISELQKQLRIE